MRKDAMFYYEQFETFDPVSGDVPEYPFSYLPEIAWRARALLIGRATDKIVTVAKMISRKVDGYFLDVRDTEIYRLRSEMDVNNEAFETFFEWDGGTKDNGQWLFKDHMENELDIQTANNTSEVDALKTIIEKRDSCFFLPEGAPEPEPEEYPEGKDYELFAVLSLWLLADALRFLNKTGLSIAGDYAIKAMDAVCYAEHLREAEWLVSFANKKSKSALAEALRQQKSEQQKWIQHCENERKARLRDKNSMLGKTLNLARHKKNHKAKAIVIAEWAKDTSAFPSAEKAGRHFADWLVTENIVKTIEPRTVTGWIRDYAKQKGVKLR